MSHITLASMARWTQLADLAQTEKCRAKRRKMASIIIDQAIPSIYALVRHPDIRGNTRDQTWLSQMMRDGELRMDNGRLALPDPEAKDDLNRLDQNRHNAMVAFVTRIPEDHPVYGDWVVLIKRTLAEGQRMDDDYNSRRAAEKTG